MSRRKTIDLIFCSVLALVGCTEPEHECEAADMMMIWRIIAVASLLLCLLLAYFLWRSYKKYERLLATTAQRLEASEEPQRLEALPTTAEKPQRLEALPTTAEEPQRSEALPTTTEELQRLEALPNTAEEPTAQEQLFHRLCLLMDGPDQIYTDTELDRARLAQLLGTNEHYVSDAVSACTNGGSIADFLNGYRLRYAVRLLATTNDSIGLIAELSGFSRRSFYRVFDEEYHTSPSEYRKAMRKA